MQWRWIKNPGLPILIVAILIIASFLLFGDIEEYFLYILDEAREQQLLFSVLSFLILASDILLPVPSSIIMFINGYVLGVVYGALISLAALMVGSIIGYYLGKFSFIGLGKKKNQSAVALMESYGLLAIVISRGLPVLAETISIVCGYNQMNFRRYLLYSFIGYIPICFLYSFFGQIGQEKNLFLFTFLLSLLLAAGLFVIARKYFKQPIET